MYTKNVRQHYLNDNAIIELLLNSFFKQTLNNMSTDANAVVLLREISMPLLCTGCTFMIMGLLSVGVMTSPSF